MALIAGLHYLSKTSKGVFAALDRIGTTVRFVWEEYDPDMPQRFEGKVYKALEELITLAEREILQVGAHHDTRYFTSDHISRQRYFDALEGKLREMDEKGRKFTYTRLHQVPPKLAQRPVKDLLHEKSREHFRRMVAWRSDSGESDVQVYMKRIEKRVLVPHRIIDERYVILELDAIALDGTPYSAGILIIDDRGQKIVGRLRRDFETSANQGHAIRQHELAGDPAPLAHPVEGPHEGHSKRLISPTPHADEDDTTFSKPTEDPPSDRAGRAIVPLD